MPRTAAINTPPGMVLIRLSFGGNVPKRYIHVPEEHYHPRDQMVAYRYIRDTLACLSYTETRWIQSAKKHHCPNHTYMCTHHRIPPNRRSTSNA